MSKSTGEFNYVTLLPLPNGDGEYAIIYEGLGPRYGLQNLPDHISKKSDCVPIPCTNLIDESKESSVRITNGRIGLRGAPEDLIGECSGGKIFGIYRIVDLTRAQQETIFEWASQQSKILTLVEINQLPALQKVLVPPINGIPLTRPTLKHRLPGAEDCEIDVLFKQLSTISGDLLDRDSIRPEKVTLEPVTFPVEILNIRTGEMVPLDNIPTSTGAMYVVEVLPNDAGVRLVGTTKYHYNAGTAEYVAEVEAAKLKRASDLAICRKLIVDLPIAHANSVEAMTKLRESDPATIDLSELGAMVLEQDRITRELKKQTAALAELESLPPVSVDTSKFTPYTFQVTSTLHFGLNRLGGIIYHLLPQIRESSIEWIRNPPVAQKKPMEPAVSSPVALDHEEKPKSIS